MIDGEKAEFDPVPRDNCAVFVRSAGVHNAEHGEAAMNDRAAKTEKAIKELSVENDVLLAQYESSMGLDEIEQYATEVLGMQRCAPGQIVYLEAPGDTG